jgi:hypothetical protein
MSGADCTVTYPGKNETPDSIHTCMKVNGHQSAHECPCGFSWQPLATPDPLGDIIAAVRGIDRPVLLGRECAHRLPLSEKFAGVFTTGSARCMQPITNTIAKTHAGPHQGPDLYGNVYQWTETGATT